MLFIEMIIGDLMFELVAKAGDQNCCMECEIEILILESLRSEHYDFGEHFDYDYKIS